MKWGEVPSRRIWLPALGIAVGAIAVAAVLGHRSVKRLETAHHWVGHSHETLRAIERLRGRVNTVHASHRGLAAATRGFVDRHDSLLRETLAGFAEVEKLTRDNPAQRKRLDSLHVALNALVLSSRRLAERNPPADAPPSALRDDAATEAHFSAIAAVVERLEREEESLLAARTAVADAATNWARAVVIVSLVFAALLALLALSPLVRALRRSRRIQQALTTSEARYRQLVEGAADAILITANGACVEANAEAERLFGCSRGELSGKPLGELISSDLPQAMEAFARLEPGGTTSAESIALRRDGERRPVEVSAAGFPDGVVQFIVRDVTERKAVERLKDEFVSVVSHELRTPLTAIRGSIVLLKSAGETVAPAQRERLLALAESNANRLVRLVNDILDFERFSSGSVPLEPSEADLGELAAEVVESVRPLADEAGVEVGIRGSAVTVMADRVRISQVLTNLVGNAIKFSPRGAAVQVEVGMEDGAALVVVRDHGRGIPADQLEAVFERFHQVDKSDARQKGGTGLGLAISRQIVRQHGGRIWAESVMGAGSTFSFTVPLLAE
jgi:PAS domain S-box-containing protein